MPLDSGDGVAAEATSWSSCYCRPGLCSRILWGLIINEDFLIPQGARLISADLAEPCRSTA